MRKNAKLTYLEQKQRRRAIHKWLKNSSKFMYLTDIDKKYDIDVPVENDVKMEFSKRGNRKYGTQEE